MAKNHSADVFCPSCQSRVFYVGTQFNSNGKTAYTLRCAKCTGRNGEGTYVKNVSSEVYDQLRNTGRIVARLQSTPSTSATNPPTQGTTPAPAIPNPPSLGTVPAPAIPNPPSLGTTPPNQPTPFDLDPTVPPPYMGFGNADDNLSRPANCPACQMKKPISVEGTEFNIILTSRELTYLNKYTGQVIFTHKIAYCPYCGSRLE